jgi:hypothetical protein
MNRLATFGFAALLGLSLAPNAFGWGAVTGPRGGAAYRGPAGGAAVRGPAGGAAVRGPAGGAAARGPYGGAAVRTPYGGAAAVRGPYGGVAYVGGVRPWVRAPYYGAVVAGVTIGAVIAATTVPPAPAPELCWYWSSPAQNQGYWDYCS